MSDHEILLRRLLDPNDELRLYDAGPGVTAAIKWALAERERLISERDAAVANTQRLVRVHEAYWGGVEQAHAMMCEAVDRGCGG